MVINGNFREDLLYRLNTFHLTIPTLSERPQDIEQLAISFAESTLSCWRLDGNRSRCYRSVT